MSTTQFTLCNDGVPPSIGLLTYMINDAAGKNSKITVEYGSTVLYPTSPKHAPWTVTCQITGSKSSIPILSGDTCTIGDPSAEFNVDFNFLVVANETPTPPDNGWPDDWKPIYAPIAHAPLFEAPVTKKLDFPMQAQAQTQWCWAAVSSSVADFYRPSGTEPNPDFTQCRLAGWAFAPPGKPDECCKDGGSSTCNKPYKTRLGLQHVQHLHETLEHRLSFEKIQEEIVGGRPIGVSIGWTSGGGHAVAITGYSTIDNVQYIRVQDPGGATKKLVRLTSFPSGGTWRRTFTTQA
ncbi:papain-like cysteine protease family protein [Luteimonas panaciterrae]|uniref:papain-like cysteine protease family protein n=1 Tax=Luteimonas panaciterrae TaxID=363885 RepID=UPI001CFB5601|nr:papain-like cysteine protease family protein [Luteimonas panaciterrae]